MSMGQLDPDSFSPMHAPAAPLIPREAVETMGRGKMVEREDVYAFPR